MPNRVLAAREYATLEQICAALLPHGHPGWKAAVPGRVEATLDRIPNGDDLLQLRLLLLLMERPAANAVLTGCRKAFSAMSEQEQDVYLRRLARHPAGPMRTAFQAFKRLSAIDYYAEADDAGSNPTWQDLKYPGPIAPPPDLPRRLQPLSLDRDTTLDCDAVVIGSGAGGGMVAAELAEAGHDVVVLEQGGYYAEADFDQREIRSLRRLYLDGGLTASKDQGVTCLAGSCLGGGTIINYTTSFRTPDSVREEWSRISGLDLFRRADFSRSLDAACARLHVNLDHNLPSARDAIMARGLQALGWHVAPMPRDVQDCTQDDVCGYCGLGCVRGAKCSSLKTCLQSAWEHGARLLVDCTAQRVRIERGRVTGVIARTVQGHAVTVRARVVIVAANAIGSAALLLRSGLGSPVGRNLMLHPVGGVWGHFTEEVRPWTGTIQALYSEQLAHLDEGYGLRFETAPVHPGLLALAAPWDSRESLDRLMRQLSHTSIIGILLRDRFGGRVTVNRQGVPVISYRLSPYDQRHMRRGVEAAARVLLAAGARDVFSTQDRLVELRAGGCDTVEDWLRRVDRVGYGPNRMGYVSFHQMGTCRMGSDRRTSVVDGSGEAHGIRNLFVADGSLFPSASGVNPMVTIAALAHYVAQQIKARL